MKKSGHFKSEIYALKTKQEKWPRVAFCDMEKHGYDDNSIESLLGYISVSPEPSQIMFGAFAAPNPSQQITAGSYITFDQFWINNGNDFDLSTGSFKTPLNGSYEFSFSGNAYNTGYCYIQVLKNGMEVNQFQSKSSYYANMASTWILALDSGDEIRLKVRDGACYSDINMHRSFTGKLLEIADNL